MPEISVVVPAYQAEQCLENCVTSILAQTFRDFEVILVDDGSTDGTAELCRGLELQDARIRFLQHTHNKGLSAARNTGIMAARGKYVAFVDSDDLIFEDGFNTLYEAAERYEADVVDTRYYMKTEADNRSVLEGKDDPISQHVELEPLDGEMLLTTDVQERCSLYYQYGLHGMACNKFFRRDFLSRYGVLFPWEKTIAEDYLFSSVCLFLATRYLRVPGSFYLYCGNAASMTRKPKSERHLAMVLYSMMVGAEYFARYLRKEPFFMEDPLRLEAVQQHWFGYCKRFHIYPNRYYQGGQFTRAADAAVKGVLRERFGAQADFVAYLFHTMNAHHAEALELFDENEKLKERK